MPSDGEKFKHLNKTSQECETALKSHFTYCSCWYWSLSGGCLWSKSCGWSQSQPWGSFYRKTKPTDQKKHVMQMGLETFCAQMGFETFMGRCQETSHLLFKYAERNSDYLWCWECKRAGNKKQWMKSNEPHVCNREGQTWHLCPLAA